MIRLLRCIKKRDDISDMEFRRFWQSSTYQDIFSGYLETSDGISYQMNLVLKVDINDEIQQSRGTQAPYDGIIEVFWDNAKSAANMVNSAEGKLLVAELAEYERQFVDFSQSSISMTEAQ